MQSSLVPKIYDYDMMKSETHMNGGYSSAWTVHNISAQEHVFKNTIFEKNKVREMLQNQTNKSITLHYHLTDIKPPTKLETKNKTVCNEWKTLHCIVYKIRG